jgi:phosphoglycolate phosphatase-like HAD superfamily hydrolase
VNATLLLFDIDGTLLRRASGEHATALIAAIEEVHGVDLSGARLEGSAAGRTDGEIARLQLLAAGVPAARIDAHAAAVRTACCRIYAELCPPDLSATVVAGMPRLLQSLGASGAFRLSLVTGNFEPVARLKLRAAGLSHWFSAGQGGFGSDACDRAMLPPIARRRAGQADGLGRSWPRERTLVIGDTPRDIACARADGLRCVAVTTGPHARAELLAADAVAESTSELGAAIERLAGGARRAS